jgi:hypothetical protein
LVWSAAASLSPSGWPDAAATGKPAPPLSFIARAFRYLQSFLPRQNGLDRFRLDGRPAEFLRQYDLQHDNLAPSEPDAEGGAEPRSVANHEIRYEQQACAI